MCYSREDAKKDELEVQIEVGYGLCGAIVSRVLRADSCRGRQLVLKKVSFDLVVSMAFPFYLIFLSSESLKANTELLTW